MDIDQVKIVCFSPTGTTRKVLESIAAGIAGKEVEHIDLTLPAKAGQTVLPFSGELVIIGAPVYGGRLPADAVKRFSRMKANGTPAILIVVYGNREFEDSLLELKNLAIELGFNPVAGGAFIGEHSFATQDLPIANGRPDGLDLQTAIDFGAKIRHKVNAMKTTDDLMDLKIPGRFPYESKVRSMTVAPVARKETCSVCGTCADVCPTGAISVDGSVTTETELCIRCCACVKNCPEGARVWEDKMMKTIANWLYENCSSRKEPRLFGIDA